MAFKISSTCENWFSNLDKQEPLKRTFDYYYLCLLLGLANSAKRALGEDAKEFVQEFIGDYRPFQRQIIGLLLVTHLADLGIGLDEKKAVSEQVVKLVAPMRTSQLTEEGYALLNGYAQGGFELLSENLDKPHKMVFFLQKYYELLEDSLKKNDVWSQRSIPDSLLRKTSVGINSELASAGPKAET